MSKASKVGGSRTNSDERKLGWGCVIGEPMRFVSLSMAVLCLVGCGGTGSEPEEAAAECTRIRNDVPACFNDAVYDQCVACHEECGRNCALLDSCPHQFTCDD